MTPKEKAEELVDKYLAYSYSYDNEMNEVYDIGRAKLCALIAVDEIIKSTPASSPVNSSSDTMPHFKALKYWQEVKQEIEKL